MRRPASRPAPRQGEDRPEQASSPLSPGLYLVATPIGNASDITLRALDVLARAGALAAEDTRQTRKLLDMHGIPLGDRQMISYNDRNGPERRPRIMSWLEDGKSVAYCSDAGTPMIADPGYRLVEAAAAAGHAVIPVPGPSAVLAALTLAALPTDRFLFAGFLPVKSGARTGALRELAAVPATLVFYESPRRLAAALGDMAAVLGASRGAAVAREVTKLHEETRRGTLGALAEEYAAEPPPRGEAVVVVGPPVADTPTDEASVDAALDRALLTLSVKDAARQVAEETGLPRREIYARALERRR